MIHIKYDLSGTDVSSTGYYDQQDLNKMTREFPKIGKRVKIDGRFGVITNHIIANNSYQIQFNDGDIGYYNNINFSRIHVEYPVGCKVDAYWPPDRLKLTNLADVLWPAIVTNYSNSSDSYTLKYDDGSIHPNIPSIYIKYPQMKCKDDRNDCPVLAKNQQCRLNPSFTMIHCRKSCRVCMETIDEDYDEHGQHSQSDNTEDNINQFEYFSVDIDGNMNEEDGDYLSYLEDVSLSYQLDARLNSFDEARSLNEIGEKLMLYGNISMAEQYFLRSSFLGNNDAKFNLGHIYTVSDLGTDDMGVLYLYFSALGGSLQSNLALGYRHLYGYGVPKSCSVSAQYYQKAANTLFGSQSLSPFNPMEQQNIEMIRLHDVNRRDLPMKETDEVIRFYHSHADNGDANAQMALGQLYYYGLRGFTQNFKLAINYFNLAAGQNHGDAYSMLGNIYVDGIDELNIKKNITKAIEYYNKAIKAKSIAGYTGMAFLELEGIPDKNDPTVLRKNATAAFAHFKYAAKRQDLSAIFYLGLMYFNGIGVKQKSFNEAFECFMSASRRGHAQSLYYAGYMHLNGLVTAKSCKMAVELFKMAAERTVIAKDLGVARSYYLDANYNKAYYLYSKLAIMGFEIAQSNVGWLLKRNLVSRNLLYQKDINSDLNINKTLKTLSRKSAFKYFEWSATQNNADSQRIVGDYYYYDYLGMDNDTTMDEDKSNKGEIKKEEEDGHVLVTSLDRFEEAGNYYEQSAENTLGANAQSMFNLGYMHQYGIGRKKDFEMAKRYYDLSIQNDPNGNVACYIYLALLYAQRFYFDFQNGNELKLFGYSFNAFNSYNLNYYKLLLIDNYKYYTQDLTLENVALIILIIILMIVLWIRR